MRRAPTRSENRDLVVRLTTFPSSLTFTLWRPVGSTMLIRAVKLRLVQGARPARRRAPALRLPLGAAHAAAVIAPVYGPAVGDCTTNQNRTGNRWSITAGCDSYQNEYYERPTTQTYTEISPGRFGADEYHETLDIRRARVGADANYLYVGIEMVGLNHLTSSSPVAEHLRHRYVFLMSNVADGAFGHMLEVDAPALANGGSEGSPNTVFSRLKTTGYKDTNGDVGGSGAANGLSITKSDNAAAASATASTSRSSATGSSISGPSRPCFTPGSTRRIPRKWNSPCFRRAWYSMRQISRDHRGRRLYGFPDDQGRPCRPPKLPLER